jgi:hypothetical protein
LPDDFASAPLTHTMVGYGMSDSFSSLDRA